ncbi:hypothetical protein [Streptomyces sp. NPDC052721]|uniref:hypothetical protein n=1 Tax=Streptomyces sp. NPDC052721 TaxID=3154955 RepID=UPI0034485D57
MHLREDGSAAYSCHANGTADRGLRPEHHEAQVWRMEWGGQCGTGCCSPSLSK